MTQTSVQCVVLIIRTFKTKLKIMMMWFFPFQIFNGSTIPASGKLPLHIFIDHFLFSRCSELFDILNFEYKRR